MFKPIGFLVTLILLIYSLISLALLAWYYDHYNYSKEKSDSPRIVYVNSIRADLACDLFLFVTAIVGLFLLVKPNSYGGKLYGFWFVLLVLFKIVAGSLTYSGGDDDGRKWVKHLLDEFEISEKIGTIDDDLKSFHVSYQNEIPSIILCSLFGIISLICILKTS